MPRVVSASAGLGSRDVAAGDLEAVYNWLLDARGVARAIFAVLGHPPSAGAAVDGSGARPEGAYSVRGHSIGGFGSVTTNKLVATLMRRAVRPACSGLSAVRVGEEGPADDLLPDDRRTSRSASTPSCTRSTSCRCRTRRHSATARRWPDWSMAARSSSTARSRTPSRSGRRCRPRLGPRSSRVTFGSSRSTRPSWAGGMHPGRSSWCACRASRSSGSSFGSRHSRSARARPRAALRAAGERASPLLRQARWRRRRRQPRGHPRSIRLADRRHCGHSGGQHRPPGGARVNTAVNSQTRTRPRTRRPDGRVT